MSLLSARRRDLLCTVYHVLLCLLVSRSHELATCAMRLRRSAYRQCFVRIALQEENSIDFRDTFILQCNAFRFVYFTR